MKVITLINGVSLPETRLKLIFDKVVSSLESVIQESQNPRVSLTEIKKFCNGGTPSLSQEIREIFEKNNLFTKKKKLIKNADSVCDAIISDEKEKNPITKVIISDIKDK